MNSKVQELTQTLDKANKLIKQVSKDMDQYYEDAGELDDEELEEIDNIDLGDFINKVAKKAEELEKKFKKVVK